MVGWGGGRGGSVPPALPNLGHPTSPHPTSLHPYICMLPFRYYLRVRYIECDAQKVVFNSRYSEYVDVSINEFLRAIGVLKDFTDGGRDFQRVKQTVEWNAPARFDQVLELSIAATRLGQTSFTIGTEFRIA